MRCIHVYTIFPQTASVVGENYHEPLNLGVPHVWTNSV